MVFLNSPKFFLMIGNDPQNHPKIISKCENRRATACRWREISIVQIPFRKILPDSGCMGFPTSSNTLPIPYQYLTKIGKLARHAQRETRQSLNNKFK
jgi:hypothetical protein